MLNLIFATALSPKLMSFRLTSNKIFRFRLNNKIVSLSFLLIIVNYFLGPSSSCSSSSSSLNSIASDTRITANSILNNEIFIKVWIYIWSIILYMHVTLSLISSASKVILLNCYDRYSKNTLKFYSFIFFYNGSNYLMQLNIYML